MQCKARCAFREPLDGGFVESIYPGQDIEVPDDMVERLVTEGHIERPARPEVDVVVADDDGEEPEPPSDTETAPSRKRK